MSNTRNSTNNQDFSIIDYISSNGGSNCGYCSKSGSSKTKGMWAYEMTVHDYQALIDRGWRRSGQYLYKPSLKETCCALYTIKCGALEIKLSKSQKKILKKMNRFLANGERFKSKNHNENKSADEENISNHELVFEGSARVPKPKGNFTIEYVVPHTSSIDNQQSQGDSSVTSEPINPATSESISPVTSESINPVTSESINPVTCNTITSSETCSSPSKKPKVTETKTFKPGKGADERLPLCKKAKLIRLERKRQKLSQNNESANQPQQQQQPPPLPQQQSKQGEKSLEDFLQEPESVKHRLRVELVRSQPRSQALEKTFKAELKLYQLYQMTIHGDQITSCTELQFKKFLVNSPLQIELVAVKSRAFQTTFKESSTLFTKYQKAIHHEKDNECGPDTFIDFLKDSPLKAWKPENSEGPEQGYGSFHQQYWLDDKLIAVGVLDVLPSCVSSVYFFYDPEYSDLTLGTYGALREVALTREFHKIAPNIRDYYMGFYVHTCPKMRYKTGLSPSYLLCPEAYSWHPVEKCLPLLDKTSYSRFEPNPDIKDPDGDIVLEKVLILWKNSILPYYFYKLVQPNSSSEFAEKTREYATLVGKKCAENMLFLVT